MTKTIALLAALVLSACADNGNQQAQPEEQPEPAGPQTVAVTAVEYEFQGIPESVDAGATTFTLENAGEEEHELVMALVTGDQSIDELLELPEKEVNKVIEDVGRAFAKPGLSDGFNVTLEPGRYAYVCFVESPDGPPHAFLGMRGEFMVA